MLRDSTRSGALGVALLLAASTIVNAQASDVGDSQPWWGWVLLGRAHPFVVHFPIGLLLAGALAELVQWLRGRPVPSDVGRFCLTAGLAGGALAVWFGTLNASHQSITGDSAEILERHRLFGWAVLVLGAGAWMSAVLARRRVSRGGAGIYVALLTLAASAVGVTGHFGGQLVYGSTYVSSVLPWNRPDAPPEAVASLAAPAVSPVQTAPAAEPVAGPQASSASPAAVAAPPADSRGRSASVPAGAPPAEVTPPPAAPAPAAPTQGPAAPAAVPAAQSTVRAAAPVAPVAAPPAGGAPAAAGAADGPAAPVVASVNFARDIVPLLRDTCVECHGPDKVKARLRMDSVAGLRAGGKSGPLFVPGAPDKSLMMHRVLGLDGEDQMPLDADPLTPEQIDLLRRWIAEGASFETPAPSDAQAGR